jgi:hypothetical protein
MVPVPVPFLFAFARKNLNLGREDRNVPGRSGNQGKFKEKSAMILSGTTFWRCERNVSLSPANLVKEIRLSEVTKACSFIYRKQIPALSS